MACTSGCQVAPQQIERQGISIGGGFRLTADVPILAYQWNPYGLELYSTDASLLIPKTSLDGTYIVAAWGNGPGSTWPQLRSQVTVVATEEDTHVSFITSVNVASMGGVGPFTAGIQSGQYTLGAYDVLAFEAGTLDQDVTGTVVMADKPVAVFGGHSCANVPSGSYAACDHVEEQVLPLSAWGTETVLSDAAFAQVGSSDWEVGRFFIDNPGNTTGCLDGAHVLSAEGQVGLSVVGTADANSYGYLGGVGVRSINPDPVIE